MGKTRASILLFATLIFTGAACEKGGGAADANKKEVPAAARTLAPSDAMAMIYFKNGRNTEEKAGFVAKQFQGIAPPKMQFADDMLNHYQLPGTVMNATEPAIVYLRQDNTNTPLQQTIAFVPTDRNAIDEILKTAARAPQFSESGSWVAISDAKVPQGASSFFQSPIPDADVVARVDIARMIQLYGPKADAFFQEAPVLLAATPGAGELLASFANSWQWLKTRTMLEAAGVVQEKELTLQLSLTGPKAADAAPARTVSQDLLQAVGALPAEHCMRGWFLLDMDTLSEFYQKFFGAMGNAGPKETRELMKASAAITQSTLQLLKNGVAYSLDFSDAGIQYYYIIPSNEPAADAERFIKMTRQLGSALPESFQISAGDEQKMEGVTVQSLRIQYSAAFRKQIAAANPGGALAGGLIPRDGLTFSIAPTEKHLLILLTPNSSDVAAAIRNIRGNVAPRGDFIKNVLASGAGVPDLYYEMDFRRLFSAVASLMPRAMPKISDQAPSARVAISYKYAPECSRVELRLDMAGLGRLFSEMKPR